MHSLLAQLGVTPRDVVDNVINGRDVGGNGASSPMPFTGNDLARTGVALVLAEALESLQDDVTVEQLTTLARALIEHIRHHGLQSQAEIIRVDGRAFAKMVLSPSAGRGD